MRTTLKNSRVSALVHHQPYASYLAIEDNSGKINVIATMLQFLRTTYASRIASWPGLTAWLRVHLIEHCYTINMHQRRIKGSDMDTALQARFSGLAQSPQFNSTLEKDRKTAKEFFLNATRALERNQKANKNDGTQQESIARLKLSAARRRNRFSIATLKPCTTKSSRDLVSTCEFRS
jgi:hypothetical protein